MGKSPVTEKENLLILNESDIYTGENARFSTLPSAIQSMADSIKDRGEIMTPITVELLPEPIEGKKYSVVVGFTRLAGARLLKAKEGMEVPIPARLAEVDPKERLVRQIAENHERQALTPMDRAVAMTKMKDAGFSIEDIMQAFHTVGGKKGTTLGACSKSYVYKTLALLTYPKSLQKAIHEGTVEQSAAFKFQSFDKKDWPAMVEKLEKDRLAEVERLQKEDEKLAEVSTKEAEKSAAANKLAEDLAAAEKAAVEAAAAQQVLIDEEAAALKASRDRTTLKTAELKKAALERMNAASTAVKAASVEADKREKALEALRAKKEKLDTKLAAAKAALEAKKAAKAVTAADVAKVAKDTGAAPTGKSALGTKLSPKEIRDLVGEISRPCGMPKADAILKAIGMVFTGEINVNAFIKEVLKRTGEGAIAPATTNKKK